MADIVLHKGRGEEETVQQAVDNVRRLGHSTKLILKTDNEPALLALRTEVAKRLDGQIICESPPVEEYRSNGCMENGVKLQKGVLRVHFLALEEKIGGSIPSNHPVMTWLVPHAAECITKYLMGPDGKTPYHRLWGKPIREETFEYGEQVLYRKRKSALRDLETHWLPATWLGRRWGNHTHILWDGSKTIEAYAAQRRPKEERWSKEILQAITATPWNWTPADAGRVQPHVIPGTGAPITLHSNEPENYTINPHPMHISVQDLERWGYTSNCRKCSLMRDRRKHHGVRHIPE